MVRTGPETAKQSGLWAWQGAYRSKWAERATVLVAILRAEVPLECWRPLVHPEWSKLDSLGVFMMMFRRSSSPRLHPSSLHCEVGRSVSRCLISPSTNAVWLCCSATHRFCLGLGPHPLAGDVRNLPLESPRNSQRGLRPHQLAHGFPDHQGVPRPHGKQR